MQLPTRRNLMRAFGMVGLTRWVLAHKRLVVAVWLAVTVAGIAAAPGLGNLYGNGGKSDAIVAVTTLPRGTTVDSPGVRGQLAAAFDKIVAALPGSRAASYVSTGNRSFVSADGRTTFALIEARPSGEGWEVGPSAIDAARAAAKSTRVAGARVYLTGSEVLQTDKGAESGGGPGAGVLLETLIGGLGALAVLAFVFASFVA
jgi:RND superfamily putative drug exporter